MVGKKHSLTKWRLGVAGLAAAVLLPTAALFMHPAAGQNLSGNPAPATEAVKCGSLAPLIAAHWPAMVLSCGNGSFPFTFSVAVTGLGKVSIGGHGNAVQCLASYSAIPSYGDCMPASTTQQATTYCQSIGTYTIKNYTGGSCDSHLIGNYTCVATSYSNSDTPRTNYQTAPCPG